MPEAARKFDTVGHTSLIDKLIKNGIEKGEKQASKFVAKEALKGTLILAAKTNVGKDVILSALLNVGIKFGVKGIDIFVKAVSNVPGLLVEMTINPENTDFGIIDGSENVIINKRFRAARFLDPSDCDKHLRQLLSDSGSKVYINNLPAIRRGDLLECGAIVTGGSENVFFDEISHQAKLDEFLREIVPPQPLPAPTEVQKTSELGNEKSLPTPTPKPEPLPTPTTE